MTHKYFGPVSEGWREDGECGGADCGPRNGRGENGGKKNKWINKFIPGALIPHMWLGRHGCGITIMILRSLNSDFLLTRGHSYSRKWRSKMAESPKIALALVIYSIMMNFMIKSCECYPKETSNTITASVLYLRSPCFLSFPMWYLRKFLIIAWKPTHDEASSKKAKNGEDQKRAG